MHHPPSTSTLNNYISNNEPNDSSSHHSASQCHECQHINNLQNHHSSSDSHSSSGDDGELVQPLHRHLVEHSRQIEVTINTMRQEIEKLKSANSTKDEVIEQLRRQLKHVGGKIVAREEDRQEVEFLRRQLEVENVRRQLYESAQNEMGKGMTNGFGTKTKNVGEQFTSMHQRVKNIEVKFEDRSSNSVKRQQQHEKVEQRHQEDGESSSSSQSDTQGDHHQQQKFTPTSKPHTRRIPKQTNNGSSKHLTNTQLQQTTQQYNDLQQIPRLQQHIQFCESQMLWMTNFIIAFLKMSEKFMVMFEQPVIRQKWSMKKKTKVAWRYVRQVLGWFVEGRG